MKKILVLIILSCSFINELCSESTNNLILMKGILNKIDTTSGPEISTLYIQNFGVIPADTKILQPAKVILHTAIDFMGTRVNDSRWIDSLNSWRGDTIILYCLKDSDQLNAYLDINKMSENQSIYLFPNNNYIYCNTENNSIIWNLLKQFYDIMSIEKFDVRINSLKSFIERNYTIESSFTNFTLNKLDRLLSGQRSIEINSDETPIYPIDLKKKENIYSDWINADQFTPQFKLLVDSYYAKADFDYSVSGKRIRLLFSIISDKEINQDSKIEIFNKLHDIKTRLDGCISDTRSELEEYKSNQELLNNYLNHLN